MSTTPPPFEKYMKLVPEVDLVSALRSQLDEMLAFYRTIPAGQEVVLHGTYTWTIRQVLGHLIDAERVFGYRAMRFSRNDQTPLPGFDENVFVKASNFNQRTLADLLEEFAALRNAHVYMFSGLQKEAWDRTGIACDMPWKVSDFARTMIGHARHHTRIVRERLKQ